MLLGLLCAGAAAQEDASTTSGEAQDDQKTTTRISLAGGSAEPGASVIVPVYFTPAEGVSVGRLKFEVKFVSVNLKFEKLDAGTDLENVSLKSDVTLGKNEKGVQTSTVTVLASLSSSEPSKKGIAEGLLGYLNLRIEKKGRPAIITLQASAEATELGSTKPLKNVRASGTQIEVTEPGAEPPAVTCFFFSH